ncbi:hypothetical protein RRG51_01425 [Mycoplasmopsis cynos]|uniref:hypothetical protein n=1 Tax=Mycoplasmopsis cynos TaxID=171284 RepID=UPI002B0024DD|nr:hypothetical protein [Mycoplasmopsis cynos]WQQ16411.1 hypothetical protein RRG51_01425 [Mycoplasmopsis cynos]
MNNKIIVWDLFGGGQNSVYQAIGDNPLFEIYTFDLYPEKYHNKQYVIDLSQDISYLRSTKYKCKETFKQKKLQWYHIFLQR